MKSLDPADKPRDVGESSYLLCLVEKNTGLITVLSQSTDLASLKDKIQHSDIDSKLKRQLLEGDLQLLLATSPSVKSLFPRAGAQRLFKSISRYGKATDDLLCCYKQTNFKFIPRGLPRAQ